jgi:hypothetical protein
MAPGIEATYTNVKDWLNKAGQFAPQTTAPTAGPVVDEVGQAAKLAQNMTPEELVAHATSGQTQTQLAAQQAAKEAQIAATQGKSAVEGSNFIKTITQKFAPMAEAVAPIVNNPVTRTLGRVAGPAGMAYNVYEAGKFAHDADLGGRLARGEAQFAPNAARNVMLNKNVSGYTPSREEAANLLASGDERTINIYGGRQRLQQLAR